MNNSGYILGIDVGAARVGLAIANPVAKIPRPYSVLANTQDIYKKIDKIAQAEGVNQIVVGLPRNMAGEETAQSKISRKFADKLRESTKCDVKLADETLSSADAEDSKYTSTNTEGHLDDIAACFIIDNYLNEIRP